MTTWEHSGSREESREEEELKDKKLRTFEFANQEVFCNQLFASQNHLRTPRVGTLSISSVYQRAMKSIFPSWTPVSRESFPKEAVDIDKKLLRLQNLALGCHWNNDPHSRRAFHEGETRRQHSPTRYPGGPHAPEQCQLSHVWGATLKSPHKT